MSQNRSKKSPPAVAPPIGTSDAAEPVVPSLPPVPAEGTLSTSLLAPTPPKPRQYRMPKDSLVRKKVLAIIALRAAGYDDGTIAKELQISRQCVHTYMWRAKQAGKDGWLTDPKTGKSLLDNPTDRVEYELTQKVVDNLAEMLDSEKILERGQKSVKMEATFEMARGVLFEKFKKTPEGVANTFNALKIEIVMPSTGGNVAREASMGGVPLSYVDAEVDEE